MKRHDVLADPVQHQPAAARTHQTDVTPISTPLDAGPRNAARQRVALQAHINQSPRILAQRRAMQASFGPLLPGGTVQRVERVTVGVDGPCTPRQAARKLIEANEHGSLGEEDIVDVLSRLTESELTFRSFFALGWFVERQQRRARLDGLPPWEGGDLYDLEQALDTLCGTRWWYVGGYAALMWMRDQGLEEVPTDDLDIVIGGTDLDEKVREHFPKALWLDHTMRVNGYSVQFIGRSDGEPANVHRFGSSNVLVPEAIIRNYSPSDAPSTTSARPGVRFGGGMAMGIGSLGAMVMARAGKKPSDTDEKKKGDEVDTEDLEKNKKKAKRSKRVEILKSVDFSKGLFTSK
ncbi:hypothetical protein [Rhizobacter sp. P5_C2]